MWAAWCDDRDQGAVGRGGGAAGGAAGPGAGSVVARPRLFGRLAARARVSVVSAPPESTVLYDSPVPLLEADRAGGASAVIWTTRGRSTTAIPLTARCGRLALPTVTAWRDQPPSLGAGRPGADDVTAG